LNILLHSHVQKCWILAAQAFTDNIVIGCPLSLDDDGEAELGALVLSLRWYQLERVNRGFFVRGGIAVGELYVDEDIVFGDALIEAHRIESEVACDPRIVLSETIGPYLLRHAQSYSGPQEFPYNQTLLVDADGQLFVNYLGATFDEDPDGPDLSAIKAHRESVTSMLDVHKASPAIWAKYAWAANYHNFICDEQQGPLLQLQIEPSLLRLTPVRML
jgi:hypothetical protein